MTRSFGTAAMAAALMFLGSLGCGSDLESMCEPGQEICNAEGSASFVCRDGFWEVDRACTGRSESCGIVDGKAGCYCEDGVRDCSSDGRSVRMCSGGQWVEERACAASEVCNYDGEADGLVCMAADVACDPTRERERCRVAALAGDPDAKYTADAYRCGPDGRWTRKAMCQESEVCVMRMADEERREADPLLREVAVCEPFPCQEGMEYCPAGSATGNPHVCRHGGLVKKETCGPDYACVINPEGEAVCVDWWSCTPGTEWCGHDGDAHVCGPDEKWMLLQDCEEGQACVYYEGRASCAKACTPGQRQCSSDKVAQVCGSDRRWHDAMVCGDGQECVVYEGEATCREASVL